MGLFGWNFAVLGVKGKGEREKRGFKEKGGIGVCRVSVFFFLVLCVGLGSAEFFWRLLRHQ